MADYYTFKKDTYYGYESYACYATSGIAQGDMLQWDSTSRRATNGVLGSGSIFLGIAEEANPVASLKLDIDRIRVKSNGVHDILTTNGETYSHLDPVFQGAAVNQVSLYGATVCIGRVHLPDGTQVTGTGTNRVPVRIFGSLTRDGFAASSAAVTK